MTTAAVTMVRDEADIVEATVRHMLTQVDVVIVADNRSVDGTREILEGLPVHLLNDPERGYYQSEKMARLAHMARVEHGADWVVPFDADEWWYSPHGRIGDVLEGIDAWPIYTTTSPPVSTPTGCRRCSRWAGVDGGRRRCPKWRAAPHPTW